MMGKWDALARGFELGQRIAEDFDRARDRKDMRDIAQAKPEQSEGFTAEQGDQLRAAAESGQYDIGVKTKDDGTFDSYTVTPKTLAQRGISGVAPDAAQESDAQRMVGMVRQQGVTDFMGQRTAGTMSQDAMDKARTNAMADVVARSNPVAAQRMRREQTQAERDDLRFGWEKSRAEREQRKATEADAEAEAMKALEGEVGQFMQGRLAGSDGQARAATVDDYLAATQFKAAKLMQAGKTDAAQQAIKEYSSQSFIKIQLEGAERDKALGETIAAVNAGNIEAARGFYDRFLPDGGNITGVKRSENGSIAIERQALDGRALPPMTFKDVNHLTASLTSLKDPEAVYNWSQNEFRNTLALKADARADRGEARADRAEGRAAAAHAASMAKQGIERSGAEAKAKAAVALYKEKNPNATEAELQAVYHGHISAVPKDDGIVSDFKPNQFRPDQGTVVQKDKRGNLTIIPLLQGGALGSPVKVPSPNAGGQAGGAPAASGQAPYKDGTELRGKDGKAYIVKNGVPVPK